MNTKDLSKTLSRRKRLEAIRELLMEVVLGIRTVQDLLREADEASNTGYVVIAALGRLGWIAEQSVVVAGYDFAPVVGSAHAWLLGSDSVLAQLRRDARATLRDLAD